jgi:hypothetical protein
VAASTAPETTASPSRFVEPEREWVTTSITGGDPITS